MTLVWPGLTLCLRTRMNVTPGTAEYSLASGQVSQTLFLSPPTYQTRLLISPDLQELDTLDLLSVFGLSYSNLTTLAPAII